MRGITRPLSASVALAQKISLGELDVDLDIDQKDEIGVLADSLRAMLRELLYKSDLLQKIAGGT